MPWPQAQAPNGGRQVMDTYQFSGIPFILVIDQNGNLYRKNVRGQQIQEAICECLTGKPTQDKKEVSKDKSSKYDVKHNVTPRKSGQTATGHLFTVHTV